MLKDYIGQRLTFDTAAPAILGSQRKNLLLLTVLDRDTALLFRDVTAVHAQVKNIITTLPANSSSYMYGKFQASDGTIEILGEPWIVASSIKAVQTRKLIFTIEEDVTEDTERLAREAWAANGITKFKVEQVSDSGTVAS